MTSEMVSDEIILNWTSGLHVGVTDATAHGPKNHLEQTNVVKGESDKSFIVCFLGQP